MKIIRLSPILTAAFLLLSPLSTNSAPISATLPYLGTATVSSDVPAYYSLNLAQIPPDLGLYLSVSTGNDSNVGIYISLNETNQTPNDPQTADYSSADFSENFIIIPPNKLSKTQNLYVGLVCLVALECRARISFEPIKVILPTSTEENDTQTPIQSDPQVTPIEAEQRYHGILDHSHYKYFSLDVQCYYCTLLISAKPLDDKELSVVVAPPDYQELPTISSPRFQTRELYGSKFTEINSKDLGSKSLMSGTWVIGVYGNEPSKFSLIVLIEGAKLTELEENKLVEVPIEPRHLVNFLYHPQTSNPLNLWVRKVFTWGGEAYEQLPVYITAISRGEDIVSNLPSQTYYQWTSPSDIDREACVECLYLITLDCSQMVGWSVELAISERQDQIMDLLDDSSITNSLLPNASSVIILSYDPMEDIYISVTSEGEKLTLYTHSELSVNSTNYHWMTELSCSNQTQVLKLPKAENTSSLYPSERVNIYAMITNPTTAKTTYTLTIHPQKKDRNQQQKERFFRLSPKSSKAIFLDSSTEKEKIELLIDFGTYYTLNDYKTMTPRPEVKVRGYFWHEDVSGIPATAILMSKANILAKYLCEEYEPCEGNELEKLGQVFKATSQVGRYIFVITNPTDEWLELTTLTLISTNEKLFIEKNSQIGGTLPPGKTETYEISFPTSGAWYLWGYPCKPDSSHLPVLSSIQQGVNSPQINFTRMVMSGGAFYKIAITEEKMNTQLIKVSSFAEDDSLNFVLKSNFFPGSRIYNYELVTNKTYYELSNRVYPQILVEKKMDKMISVYIIPILIDDYDQSDTILYEVQACPHVFQDSDFNYCTSEKTCVIGRSDEYKIENLEENRPKIVLNDLAPARYFVKVLARIMSHGQEVRFFSLKNDVVEIYDLASIYNFSTPNRTDEFAKLEQSSNDSSSTNVLLVAVILVVVGLVSYGCLKKHSRKGRGDYELESGESSGINLD